MTQNKEPAYSPISVGDKPIALKARMPTTVPPSKGNCVPLTTAIAALWACSPFCMRTKMPSVTTMALSTSIPRAMIKAPSDTRCMAISSIYMAIKVPATVSNNTSPTITPLRQPINRISTSTTIATAAAKFSTKPSTASRTESDWYDTTCKSIPTGRCESNSFKRARTASPISTTLPPATWEIPRPMAG